MAPRGVAAARRRAAPARPILARLAVRRRPRRPSPALRAAVRAAAGGALAAAIAVPLAAPPAADPAGGDRGRRRRRARSRSPCCARARTSRDVALFTLQMWAFTIAHELPYDDPEALRRRLRIRYPIVADRVLGARRAAERAPAARAQPPRPGHARSTACSRSSTGPGSSSPTWRCSSSRRATSTASRARRGRWPPPTTSAARSTSRCPTAPPWWAAEKGYLEPPVERIAGRGRRRGGRARRRPRSGGSWSTSARASGGRPGTGSTTSLGGNPWAAMPSLHFATSLMAALLLAEIGPLPGALGAAYAGDARVRARLPRRALRHRPARRRGAGRARPPRRAARRAGGRRGQPACCSGSSGSPPPEPARRTLGAPGHLRG